MRLRLAARPQHMLVLSTNQAIPGSPGMAGVVSVAVASVPQRPAHALGSVAHGRIGDMDIALSGSHIGMSEDLLDREDVNALLGQERPGSVPAVVYTDVPNAGRLQ